MRYGSLQLHVFSREPLTTQRGWNASIQALIPVFSEGGCRLVLRNSQLVAYDTMLQLVKSRIEDMMAPQEQVAWMPLEAPMVQTHPG